MRMFEIPSHGVSTIRDRAIEISRNHQTPATSCWSLPNNNKQKAQPVIGQQVRGGLFLASQAVPVVIQRVTPILWPSLEFALAEAFVAKCTRTCWRTRDPEPPCGTESSLLDATATADGRRTGLAGVHVLGRLRAAGMKQVTG